MTDTRTLRRLRQSVLAGGATVACAALIVALSSVPEEQPALATAGQIMSMTTTGSTFYKGRCFRVDFRLQTDSLDASSADLVIPYNTSLLQPHSNASCSSVATQLLTDGLFPTYPSTGNEIEGGTLRLTGADLGGDNPVDTGAAPNDALFAHIFFKVLDTNASYPLAFTHALGATNDTNIAEDNGNGSDVLDSVVNLTLTFADDVNAPTFSSINPSNGSGNVSVTKDLSFVATDSGAGINSSSLKAKLNNSGQTVSVSSCTTTNSNRVPSCTATSNLPTLSYNTTYTITLTGADLASTTHTGSTYVQFTTEDDDDAPYVENRNPASGATAVSTSSNIVFRIKDYKNQAGVTAGLGVDISSVQVTVTVGAGTPTTYDSSDAEFSYTGTSADYTVTINPASNFPQNTTVAVAVAGQDLHVPANVMTTNTYSFTTADTVSPTLSNISPASGATGVNPAAAITFTASDSGAGIDINDTDVTIEGTTYDSGDSEFSYTGTSASYSISVNPSGNFSGNQVINVTITTEDLASPANTASSSYLFTIASSCTTCSVDGEDPERFATDASESQNISFHVKNTSGRGIDSGSIVVVLGGDGDNFPSDDPLTLTGGHAYVSLSGNSGDYLVTIDLPYSLETASPVSVTIDAEDSVGLVMPTVSYGFSAGAVTSTAAADCPPAAVTSTQSPGGGAASTNAAIKAITSEDLPMIIAKRRLPEDIISVEQLTPEEAAIIEEVMDELHAAPITQPVPSVVQPPSQIAGTDEEAKETTEEEARDAKAEPAQIHMTLPALAGTLLGAAAIGAMLMYAGGMARAAQIRRKVIKSLQQNTRQ